MMKGLVQLLTKLYPVKGLANSAPLVLNPQHYPWYAAILICHPVLDSGVNLDSIAINSIPYIFPWILKPAIFDFSLRLIGNQSEVSPTIFPSKFKEFLSHFLRIDTYYEVRLLPVVWFVVLT